MVENSNTWEVIVRKATPVTIPQFIPIFIRRCAEEAIGRRTEVDVLPFDSGQPQTPAFKLTVPNVSDEKIQEMRAVFTAQGYVLHESADMQSIAG